jgi:hypothetical protein
LRQGQEKDVLKKCPILKKSGINPLGRKKFGECPDGLPRGRQNLGFFTNLF